jgi:deazaflavin-dependent oxidoreductase (nitroreductase family)
MKSAQVWRAMTWFPAIGKRVVPPLDKFLHKVSNGRVGMLSPSGYPGLMLTTVGAKTGQEREVPLLYVPHAGKFYLIGSNWGQARHPAWTANLMATPEATLTIRGERIPVTARLLEGEDRERIWPVLTGTWPNFDVYTERSGRELRVFEMARR